jgi:hypothetical protein
MADWPIPPTSAAGFPGMWNFKQVASIAITPRGNVLVLHRGANPVLEFDRSEEVRPYSEWMLGPVRARDKLRHCLIFMSYSARGTSKPIPWLKASVAFGSTR